MTTRRTVLQGAAGGLCVLAGLAPAGAGDALARSEAEWRRRLTPAAFDVLRREGTEPPFASPLLHEARRGVFACAGCGLDLFASEAKFDSRTGWPSFFAPLPQAVTTREDHSLFMVREAVACARCAGHLGHVFDDGPPPTGLRYCINGVALAFRPAAAKS